MALRRIISKRFSFNRKRNSPAVSIENAQENIFRRDLFSSFLDRKSINQSARRLPQFPFVHVGDKLREKLWPLHNPAGDHIRYDITPPAENLSVGEMKKIWRSCQMEKLRSKLREIPMKSIAYSEFVKICSDVCENNKQGLECAKMLDDAGNVIVLGKAVFLRPDQVIKSMEKLLYESIATTGDRRREELEKLEKEKVVIDVKAESLVRRELYCGMIFIVVQTMGFMRLTFWELSWDVMEPICYFVNSFYFALVYGFFIRTSKEPTFESLFQRRFLVKQAKLMKVHNFDVQKYKHLCKVFYPDDDNNKNI